MYCTNNPHHTYAFNYEIGIVLLETIVDKMNYFSILTQSMLSLYIYSLNIKPYRHCNDNTLLIMTLL